MAIIPLNFGTVGGGEGSSAITVIDTPDEHGGTIREIIAVDISKDTVSASTLLKGITAHDRYGDPVTGTHECSGTPTLQSKTATPSELTQYVTADSGYDGLSDVTVNPIPSSYVIPAGTKSISSNGTHNVSGFASASVLVSPSLQTKTATPTTLSQEITPDNDYDGLSSVTVGAIPSQYIIPSGSTSINQNGTYNVTSYASAVVNVSGGSPTLQSKTVTPIESEQTVTADSGYDGLSSVTVEAIDDEYIGSGVTQRSSSDLTVSGATVTAPAGYYGSAASKSVASGSAGTPTATKGTVSNHSVTVTPSVTNTTGYISGGTKTGTGVSVSASELVSGTKTITQNGTDIDVTNYASVDVNVSGSGIVQIYQDENGYVVLDDEGSNVTTITPLTVTENGTYGTLGGSVAYQPVTVNVSGGGGGSLDDQVRFFDYDGTLVNSYSKADFNALTAMPANPSHSGLTAQGWNWSLSEAKAQLTAIPDGVLNIGQMYTTNDGKTRLYIHIDEDTPDNRLTFYVRFTSSTSNNVSLDWGDGTVETKGSTTATNYEHTYAASGDYVVKLTVNSGTISFVGTSGTDGNSIFGSRASTNIYNRGRIIKAEIGGNVTSIGTYAFYQCYSLTSITIPSGVTSIGTYAFNTCYSLTNITIPSTVTSIGAYAFYSCYSVTSITIPSTVTSIGNYAFYQCYSLTSITMPSTVTSIGNYAFQSCYSLTNIMIPSSLTSIGSNVFYGCYPLTNITIPSSVTSIGGSAFYACYSLTSITIPSTVTSIGTSAFAFCYGIGEYHFEPTTPPTLGGTNAFNSIASDCKIYVPYSANHSILEAYQTATNWSTYASYMVEESA